MDLRSEFEAVALVHLDAVYRAAVALCGVRDAAEDLVQTTFAKAFENFGSFKKGTNCKAWLIRILRNTWIDYLRQQGSRGRQVPLDEELIVEEAAVEQTAWTNARDLLENFSDEQIIKALGRIPEEQRLTLYLVDVEEMSHEEVGEIMEIAVGTVKSRTSRARAMLKEILASYAKDMRLAGGEK
jgi:RNA polymerase sigma-70 factor (ECF subfamily)